MLTLLCSLFTCINVDSKYIKIDATKNASNDFRECDTKYFRWIWTHWGRVMHICVNKITITGSDNGLLAGQSQAIIWNNAWILLIGHLGTNFRDILIWIQTFSLRKTRLKTSAAKCCPVRLSLNVLNKFLPFNGLSQNTEWLYVS